MIDRELNFSGPSPVLYLIATPIGNVSELSSRALEILAKADYVAAEDTRNSGELLHRFNLNKNLISCHEHNEEEASAKIISLLKEGKAVCYMSDAGYPGVSDPGGRLVKNCLENGIKVSVVSGPLAAINALVCSGLATDHFYFHGFLSPKDNQRIDELNSLSDRRETLIFYESPHRIGKTLLAMAATLGDRKACIARELTKIHEEFIRGTLSELALLDEETLRGEMVIVVEGAKENLNSITDEQIAMALRQELDFGRSGKEAVSTVASTCKVAKNRVYGIYLKTFK